MDLARLWASPSMSRAVNPSQPVLYCRPARWLRIHGGVLRLTELTNFSLAIQTRDTTGPTVHGSWAMVVLGLPVDVSPRGCYSELAESCRFDKRPALGTKAAL